MEKKWNLMEQEKGNLSPHHLARELCVAPLAPILTREQRGAKRVAQRGAAGLRKEITEKGAALIHLAQKTKSEGGTRKGSKSPNPQISYSIRVIKGNPLSIVLNFQSLVLADSSGKND